MPPRPDGGDAGKQCESVFEFERPLGSLVPKDIHADESAGPATHRAEQHERQFGDALTGAACTPFVIAKCKERHHVDGGEPDDGDFIQVAQVRRSFTKGPGGWRVDLCGWSDWRFKFRKRMCKIHA